MAGAQLPNGGNEGPSIDYLFGFLAIGGSNPISATQIFKLNETLGIQGIWQEFGEDVLQFPRRRATALLVPNNFFDCGNEFDEDL